MARAFAVLLIGCAGALCGLLLEYVLRDAVTTVPKIGAILILGMMAAGFGVYVFPGVDTAHRKTRLGFAFACGLSWPYIFESIPMYVKALGDEKTSVAASREANDAADSSKYGMATGTHADRYIGRLRDNLVEATSELPAIGTGVAKNKVQQAREAGINAIARVGARAPLDAAEALQDIGTSAKAAGDDKSAALAATALKGLLSSATVPVEARQLIRREEQQLRANVAPNTDLLERITLVNSNCELTTSQAPSIGLRLSTLNEREWTRILEVTVQEGKVGFAAYDGSDQRQGPVAFATLVNLAKDGYKGTEPSTYGLTELARLSVADTPTGLRWRVQRLSRRGVLCVPGHTAEQ